MAARAKNLDLVFQACEFWTQLKEALLDACRRYEQEGAKAS